MTTDEKLSKMDEIKEKTIKRLLGDVNLKTTDHRKVVNAEDIKKMQEERAKRDKENNISVTCQDFFESQRKQRENGGYMVTHIEEIPKEIPPPIK